MNLRHALNIAAAVMAFLAALLWYGTMPRPWRSAMADEPEPEAVPDVEYVTCADVCEALEASLTNDVFADNFDPPPGDDLDWVIDRLIEIENEARDPDAVGDVNRVNKAYGLLQIRKPYLDDVNRLAGTNLVMSAWGKPALVIEDMKDEDKARWTAKFYLSHYGRSYERKTGKTADLRVYGRIHNGGPNGWRRGSTNEYVDRLMGGVK